MKVTKNGGKEWGYFLAEPDFNGDKSPILFRRPS
jgi:hypothetical protein